MHISAQNISVRFPVFDAKHRSFKNSLLQVATGGKLISQEKGPTYVEALKNINLEIKEGERVALVGHNGSGKTTLLRVLAGVYPPTTGNLTINGKITSLLDSKLGMDNELTGIENIKTRGIFLGMTSQQIKTKTEEIIEFSELGDFINLPVRTYSSGMILRLAFSITTCITPEILIMDEWLSVGDKKFKKKAEKRLNDFVESAGILIFATHDGDLAKKICNKQLNLFHGTLK